MTLHTIYGETRDTFDPATAGPDTRKTTLLVQSEGPPETATHFWVNGHRHARADLMDMLVAMTAWLSPAESQSVDDNLTRYTAP
jgi:hypothetical protein